MVDVESVAVISTEASGEAFPWSGVELFDKSRGGDETRHKYLTYSEWHTDSKLNQILKNSSVLYLKGALYSLRVYVP